MNFLKKRNEETKANEYMISITDNELNTFKSRNEVFNQSDMSLQESMLVEIISKLIANEIIKDIRK